MEVFAAPREMRDFPCCHVGVNWQIPNEISNPLIIHTLGSALLDMCTGCAVTLRGYAASLCRNRVFNGFNWSGQQISDSTSMSAANEICGTESLFISSLFLTVLL